MTTLFTIELIVTFVAHFGWLFFKDAWRIFDTIVVAVSYVGLSGMDMPAVKSIRALRVLRAVRLLKKSKSLKPIVDALFASILPVCNSMLLLALITAIYASMAVGLFGEQDPVLFGRLSRYLYRTVDHRPAPTRIATSGHAHSGVSLLSGPCEGLYPTLTGVRFSI